MKDTFESLVHTTIPVSKAIGWHIKSLEADRIHCKIALEPNINIHGTGFAGSQFAAAMATGWTLMKAWYESQNLVCELVAAEANIKYIKPVTMDFECIASIDRKSEAIQKVITRLRQSRSAGYLLEVELQCQQQTCAIISIQFVFKSSKEEA